MHFHSSKQLRFPYTLWGFWGFRIPRRRWGYQNSSNVKWIKTIFIFLLEMLYFISVVENILRLSFVFFFLFFSFLIENISFSGEKKLENYFAFYDPFFYIDKYAEGNLRYTLLVLSIRKVALLVGFWLYVIQEILSFVLI